MSKIYMAVTVEQDKNERLFEPRPSEEYSPGYYSYVFPCKAGEKDNTMKTFEIDGTNYAIELCTAICAADAGDESKRQNALLVSCEYNGELFESIVFGYDMPETEEAFDDICADSSAWESDYTVVGTAVRR